MQRGVSYFRPGPASLTALFILGLGVAAPMWQVWPRTWAIWFSPPSDAFGAGVFGSIVLGLVALLRLREWAVERSGSDGRARTVVYGALSVAAGLLPLVIAYSIVTHRETPGPGAMAPLLVFLFVAASAAVAGALAISFGLAAWSARHPARWAGAAGMVLGVCNLMPLLSLLTSLLYSRLR